MDGTRPLVALIVVWLVAGCAPGPRPGGEPDEAQVTYHTVQRGETVSSIARRYHVPVIKVIRDNRLRDPDLIRVGQQLRIVGGSPEASLRKVPAESLPLPKGSGPAKGTGKFQWPVRGTVVRRYSKSARGVAIAAAPGTPVAAADGGHVVLACDQMRGLGKVVVLDHGNGYTTAYAHNAELLVKEGESVRRGQAIARAGATGRASRPKVEFRLYRQGEPQDPLRYLR